MERYHKILFLFLKADNEQKGHINDWEKHEQSRYWGKAEPAADTPHGKNRQDEEHEDKPHGDHKRHEIVRIVYIHRFREVQGHEKW